MRITTALSILASLCLHALGAQNYEATWESLQQHEAIPQWLSDAKLGIYAHWGLYSVPAYAEKGTIAGWYPYYMYRNTALRQHHIKTYGPNFEYHDFIPLFTAKQFDAPSWAQLIKDSGARFAGTVTLHHDGFSMWDSQVNPWNCADKGPKQDIIAQLYKELQARGIKTIATFHHARNLQRYAQQEKHWSSSGNARCSPNSHFAYDPQSITSTQDPELKKFYGNFEPDEGVQYWLDILEEFVDSYSPDILWFDSWLDHLPEKARQQMAAQYFNHANKTQQAVSIAFKQQDMPAFIGINDIEQGGHKDVAATTWMTDVTLDVGDDWSHVKGQQYKSAQTVLRNMIDVWSKNGIVLLNLSPRADGSICEEQQNILRQIGQWLKQYGEAVYNTHAYTTYGFGHAQITNGRYGGQAADIQYNAHDVRFTLSKDEKSFYIFMLGQPIAGEKLNLPALPFQVQSAQLLGSGVNVEFSAKEEGLQLTIPNATMDELANVIKLEI